MLMKSESVELKRGEDGEIDLDSLMKNIEAIQICPVFRG